MATQFSNQLTEREKDVAELLLQGMSNKQIALSLNVSKSTVEFHLKNVYRKLEVGSRAEAILHLSRNLPDSTGAQKENLLQPIGEENERSVYSSHEKRFFNPEEEKTMKNRTLISIILSVLAIVIALTVFAFLWLGKNNARFSASNDETYPPEYASRGVEQIQPGATPRQHDEVLLLLQSTDTPYRYAAVFASMDCFISKEGNCAFTEAIPFSVEEALNGPIFWMPDGERGLYANGNAILFINRLERVNAKSGILASDILMTNSLLWISPDARWLVESVANADPYASDLVMIKTTSGRVNKLDIGLDECNKTPLGWLTETKFLFRCEVSTGETSKKSLSEVRYYSYEATSGELLEFEKGTDAGFDSLSPNGQFIFVIQKDGSLQVKDLFTGETHSLPLEFSADVIAWSHDSSKVVLVSSYDGNVFIADANGFAISQIYALNKPCCSFIAWFPDNNHIAIGYFDELEDKTQTIVISVTGNSIEYDAIPTTDGYNVIGLSPLPAIQK